MASRKVLHGTTNSEVHSGKARCKCGQEGSRKVKELKDKGAGRGKWKNGGRNQVSWLSLTGQLGPSERVDRLGVARRAVGLKRGLAQSIFSVYRVYLLLRRDGRSITHSLTFF